MGDLLVLSCRHSEGSHPESRIPEARSPLLPQAPRTLGTLEGRTHSRTGRLPGSYTGTDQSLAGSHVLPGRYRALWSLESEAHFAHAVPEAASAVSVSGGVPVGSPHLALSRV